MEFQREMVDCDSDECTPDIEHSDGLCSLLVTFWYWVTNSILLWLNHSITKSQISAQMSFPLSKVFSLHDLACFKLLYTLAIMVETCRGESCHAILFGPSAAR